MRQSEILNGIKVYTENGEELGFSKRAAYTSIVQVTASRITMAAPGMCKFRIFTRPYAGFRFVRSKLLLNGGFSNTEDEDCVAEE